MALGRSMNCDTVIDSMRLLNAHGADALQICLGPIDKQTLINIKDEDAKIVRKARKRTKFYVVVHGKYLYNFCRPRSQAGWSWQYDLLVRELDQASRIGADVIIHQGKNVLGLPHTEALQNFADGVSYVLSQSAHSNKLLLENSAHQGTEIGYSLADLIAIWELIPEEYHSRIGFCLDLCHVFVAGELDVRDPEAVQQYLVDFTEILPLDLVHFNDSNVKYEAHNDEHAAIGCGYIGNGELNGRLAGFQVVAKFCREHDIPMILETPASTDIQPEIELVRGLAGGPAK